MIQRDYVMRLIQQLIDSIFMLLDKKDIDQDQIRFQLEKFYEDYLSATQEFYLYSPLENVIDTLKERYGNEEYLYRIEMLVEIMYQDGMLDKDMELKRYKLSKSLELLGYLEEYSHIYSLVREGKKEVITSILQQ